MPIIKWGHETEIIPVSWLWKPMIPFGKVTIIEGDGGDGKTTLILTIAAMLSQGTPPPALERGHLRPSAPISPVTTFYLTNEDEVADSSLKRYIRANGDPHRFAYSGELQQHMTLAEDELLEVINATGCRLLIIDPFQAFLPDGTNLGSITKMRTIFTMLANVAKSTGVAIVLVGHLNKSEGSKDIHRGFGSADIAASVRSILMVEMDRKDREKRWIRAIKSNFDESDYAPIRLILDDERKLTLAEMELDEEESAPITKKDHATVLLQILLKGGPLPISIINSIMEGNGIGSKTAQRAKNDIHAVQIYQDGVPCWSLENA